MLWILLMFAGMGLFMLGIVFGEFIDVWYCRTKYDRDDSYKVIEEREDTARKLNREKQKLESEVARLNSQVDHLDKVWAQEKLKLTKELIEHKNRGSYYYDEWKAECKIVEQVIGIVCPKHKEEIKNVFARAKLKFDKIKDVEPVISPLTEKDLNKKEEWFDLNKKRPEDGQKIYLKDKLTGTQDLGEFVDRSALGISFIKRNGQNHTSSLMESQWEWRPI